MKICTVCKKELDEDKFGWVNAYRLRRKSSCKECLKEKSKNYESVKHRVRKVRRRKGKYEN